MSCPSDFTEWTLEEKRAFAEKKMLEMKFKNEKLMKRHTEVENDRLQAESRNSAITNVKSKKDNRSSIKADIRSREWDRGKPSIDSWDIPEQPSSFRQYRTGRDTQDLPRERESYNLKTKSFRNRQYEDYQKSHFPRSPKSTRPGKQMHKSKNTRRKYSHSRSSSRSESDFAGKPIRASTLWQNDKLSEDQNKKHRLGKWLKDVNKSLAVDQTGKSKRSYSKFERFENSSADSSDDCVITPSKNDSFSDGFKKDGTVLHTAGMKNKRSPQTSSNSSSKNGHMRKRMLFDHNATKAHSWDSKFPKSNVNAGSFQESQDNWRSAVNSKDSDDNWKKVDQTDIKWKLSDEEVPKYQEPKYSKNDIKTQDTVKSSMKQDAFKVTVNPKKHKRTVIYNKDIACGTSVGTSWADRIETDASSKFEACSKIETNDAWGEYESTKHVNEISEKMKMSCTIKNKMEVDKEKTVSDGWSTVSEEGEIHTEDEDADSEWKKKN